MEPKTKEELVASVMVTPEMQAVYYALRNAIQANALAVYATERKSDGKPVGLLTAMLQDDDYYIMMPLAVLLTAADAEEYLPPAGAEQTVSELSPKVRILGRDDYERLVNKIGAEASDAKE